MTAESSRIGKKIRLILVGNIHYSGIILSEDKNTITFTDKFGSEVIIGKASLVSLEVLND